MNKYRTFYNSNKETVYIKRFSGECSHNPECLCYNPVSEVQEAGYVPPRVQVLNFLNAGERMMNYRRSLDLGIDPREEMALFDRNNDILDGYRMKKNFTEKLRAYEKAVKQRQDLENEEKEKLWQQYKSTLNVDTNTNSNAEPPTNNTP